MLEKIGNIALFIFNMIAIVLLTWLIISWLEIAFLNLESGQAYSGLNLICLLLGA